MSDSQLSSDSAGHNGPASRPVRARILRFLVPIPKGKGVGAKAAWVGRRIVLWYVIIVVMLALLQRRLIYQPTRTDSIDPDLSGLVQSRLENVAVETDDGLQLHGWFVRALPGVTSGPPYAASGDGRASFHPVVIYFPGNAGHRGYRAIDLDLISRVGADVYLFDYRGYGDNPGSPTEEKLAGDARAVWQYVTGKRRTKPSHVVLLGESLGGGVATRLAAEICAAGTPPGGLILRSTFSSLPDVAAHHYWWLPVRALLIDRFPSAERIASVTCPVLVIHGTADTIVPLIYGRRLFEAAPATSGQSVAKKFAELRGAGHNDILYVARDEYLKSVRDFLDRVASVP
ncbi:MAG TPA: alpha/beta hydrolase [Planctomycetaceae bacterium]|jgi:fermentation-respiration switch protein FrsA (DUF1100 family)|nr:alpha/beta hydrolase [Planctomycetaceae bacterium]